MDFRALVEDATAIVDRMVHDTTLQTEQLLRAAGERPLRFLLQEGEVLAARDRYLDGIGEAATSFLLVCLELVTFQQSYELEVSQALGLAGTVAAEQGPVFNAEGVDELTARMQEVAGAYARHVEELQIRFDAAYHGFADACSAQLDLFKSVVAQECNIVVETLDDALQTAYETGERFTAAAATGARGAGLALVVATCVGVAATTTAVHAAGAAASTVWGYFAAPAGRD
ncbi:hypothetical protein [Streptomyces sp. WAC06614]|uniref:hypothetical protein n=1 Tax=Streptomyces sp. WAC06614 TaxID=2487416 RepID=UPI000F78A782|nr:hypothetical protein [Streptomyces sp. WAC06614]